MTATQLEAFHKRGLELYGGSKGLRDRSLFESAVAQAQNAYWYAYGDLLRYCCWLLLPHRTGTV